MFILSVSPYRREHQNRERFLEWRQAEAVQLRVRAQAVEMQEEAIEKGVSGVCAFREAYLRCQRIKSSTCGRFVIRKDCRQNHIYQE